MTKLEVFKLGTGVITGLGCYQIISGVVRNLAPPNSTLGRVTVLCGQIVITSLVAEAATNHLEKRIDQGINWLSENSTK